MNFAAVEQAWMTPNILDSVNCIRLTFWYIFIAFRFFKAKISWSERGLRLENAKNFSEVIAGLCLGVNFKLTRNSYVCVYMKLLSHVIYLWLAFTSLRSFNLSSANTISYSPGTSDIFSSVIRTPLKLWEALKIGVHQSVVILAYSADDVKEFRCSWKLIKLKTYSVISRSLMSEVIFLNIMNKKRTQLAKCQHILAIQKDN